MAQEFCMNKATDLGKNFVQEEANNQLNKHILKNGVVSKIASEIVDESLQETYICPDCNTEVWKIVNLPYKGSCEKCLSNQDILEKKLSAFEGIGNEVIPEDQRDEYECPNCQRQVYVIKGFPYRGNCKNCLQKINTSGKAIKTIEAISNEVVPEEMKKGTVCEECHSKGKYTVLVPYDGVCANCLSQKGTVQQGAEVLKGLVKGFLG